MKKKYSPEQIVKLLREAEGKIVEGRTIEEVCREIGVSDATYYNWRRTYRHLKVDQAKRLKDLQKENARLKKLVTDLSLDKAILKETSRENTEPDAVAGGGGAGVPAPGGLATSGMPSAGSAARDAGYRPCRADQTRLWSVPSSD